MKLTGLDLSLTSTGIAHAMWGTDLSLGPVITVARLKAHKRLGEGHQRLQFLMEEIGAHTRYADLVAIEGPAYDRNQGQHKLGGLWWLVAHGLWKRGTPYVVMTPTQLKKYATGKALVSKDEVMAHVIRRYPQVPITCNDEADALTLAAMCADYIGQPLVQMPEASREVLAKVDWPPLPFAA